MAGVGVRRDKAAFFSGCKSHTANSLQPEAIGAVIEVTKWLKPSISVSRIDDSMTVAIWMSGGRQVFRRRVVTAVPRRSRLAAKARDLYAKGVEAGELAIGPRRFKKYAGHF